MCYNITKDKGFVYCEKLLCQAAYISSGSLRVFIMGEQNYMIGGRSYSAISSYIWMSGIDFDIRQLAETMHYILFQSMKNPQNDMRIYVFFI